MEKDMAEREMARHANLKNKVLTHKIFDKRMQVLDILVKEIVPKSGIHKVFCTMRGELGDIDEPLDEVLKYYTKPI